MKEATGKSHDAPYRHPGQHPYRQALRTLAHGLSRWAMFGFGDLQNPVIVALKQAGDALYLPHTDVAASEVACELALREMVVTFAEVYAKSDRLTLPEVAVLWEAIGYVDALDEAADQKEQRQRELRECREREHAARTCFAEAQRERTRGQRNRQRQCREERSLRTQEMQQTAVAA